MEFTGTLKPYEISRYVRMANHPDNGKQGWWLVEGVRNKALVKADHAVTAIEMAHKEHVVDKTWECPEASYIGPELPDVYKI